MTTTPADTMTDKTGQVVKLHMEGLITTQELNKIIVRIIEKYEVNS
jgi:hypothetical protein